MLIIGHWHDRVWTKSLQSPIPVHSHWRTLCFSDTWTYPLSHHPRRRCRFVFHPPRHQMVLQRADDYSRGRGHLIHLR